MSRQTLSPRRLDNLMRLLAEPLVRNMALIAIAAGSLAILVSLLIPKSYKATTIILPNLPGANGSSLMELASGAGLAELLSGQIGGGENPVLTYPEILMSRTLLERTLLSPYPPGPPPSSRSILDALHVHGNSSRERVDDGYRKMKDVVEIRANPRSGLITLSAVTNDSLLSAYVVSRMLEELDRFNLESRSSRGRATREFVQARLGESRQEMVQAEGALTAFRSANLRIGNSPQLQLDAARLEREVMVRGELYQLLSRQFEMARIEEKRDTPTFSIIDPVRPPVRKHRPKLILNGVVAALVALAFRGLLEYMRRPAAHTDRKSSAVAASS